jgi:hypothetical protein
VSFLTTFSVVVDGRRSGAFFVFSHPEKINRRQRLINAEVIVFMVMGIK